MVDRSDACFSDVQDPTAIRESLRSSCRASTVSRGDFQLTLFQSCSRFFPFLKGHPILRETLTRNFVSPNFSHFCLTFGREDGYFLSNIFKYVFEPGTSHMMMRCKLTQQACFFSQFGGLLPFSSWRSGEDPENFSQLEELLSNQLMQCMTKNA